MSSTIIIGHRQQQQQRPFLLLPPLLLLLLTLLLLQYQQVQAACDNACSGHGKCLTDTCECWADWRTGDEAGGDCSDRVCPYELAWVDTPDENGLRHKYVECAGRGVCDRAVGECQCFEGYTGKACQRTTCPNDCSAHGRCEYLEDLPYKTVYGDFYGAREAEFPVQTLWGGAVLGDARPVKTGIGDYPVTLAAANRYWDARKTRGCVCDAGWTDIDCSRRMCPRGADPAAGACTNKHQIQTIVLQADENWNGTILHNITEFDHLSFALKFTSTLNESFVTYPLKLPLAAQLQSTLGQEIEEALLRLPNRVVDGVNVSVAFPTTAQHWNANTSSWTYDPVVHVHRNVSISITFTGDHVQGPQNLISVVSYECGAGCTPMITGLPLDAIYPYSFVKEDVPSSYQNYECGRRGKCDYEVGLCNCFEGYQGEACGEVTTIA